MNTITEPTSSKLPPLLMLGFRPFFLAAGIFAVVNMLLWMAVYSFGQVALFPTWVSHITWHAHEMVFGYSFAVIAGFLLTAVKKWTGINPASGYKLLFIFILWLLGRTLPYFDSIPLMVIAVVDSSFMLVVSLVIAVPIIKSKQTQQYGIVAKLFLMAVSNGVFYLGVLGYLEQGVLWGLYAGFYMVLALIFVMLRRLIPFFMEQGLNLKEKVSNNKYLDRASLVLFVVYIIFDVFIVQASVLLSISMALFLLHIMRLDMWYNHGMWKKPLLWILWVAYLLISLGFALKVASIIGDTPPGLAIHAFAVGGIGIITLGMMARVSLGHTGRDVANPPTLLMVVFGLLLMSAIVRVILPIVMPASYPMLVLVSQGLWASAFTVFVMVYAPYAVKKRVDGKFG